MNALMQAQDFFFPVEIGCGLKRCACVNSCVWGRGWIVPSGGENGTPRWQCWLLVVDIVDGVSVGGHCVVAFSRVMLHTTWHSRFAGAVLLCHPERQPNLPDCESRTFREEHSGQNGHSVDSRLSIPINQPGVRSIVTGQWKQQATRAAVFGTTRSTLILGWLPFRQRQQHHVIVSNSSMGNMPSNNGEEPSESDPNPPTANNNKQTPSKRPVDTEGDSGGDPTRGKRKREGSPSVVSPDPKGGHPTTGDGPEQEQGATSSPLRKARGDAPQPVPPPEASNEDPVDAATTSPGEEEPAGSNPNNASEKHREEDTPQGDKAGSPKDNRNDPSSQEDGHQQGSPGENHHKKGSSGPSKAPDESSSGPDGKPKDPQSGSGGENNPRGSRRSRSAGPRSRVRRGSGRGWGSVPPNNRSECGNRAAVQCSLFCRSCSVCFFFCFSLVVLVWFCLFFGGFRPVVTGSAPPIRIAPLSICARLFGCHLLILVSVHRNANSNRARPPRCAVAGPGPGPQLRSALGVRASDQPTAVSRPG